MREVEWIPSLLFLSLVFGGNGRKEWSRRPSTEHRARPWHRAPSTPEMGWGCSCCGSSYF